MHLIRCLASVALLVGAMGAAPAEANTYLPGNTPFTLPICPADTTRPYFVRFHLLNTGGTFTVNGVAPNVSQNVDTALQAAGTACINASVNSGGVPANNATARQLSINTCYYDVNNNPYCYAYSSDIISLYTPIAPSESVSQTTTITQTGIYPVTATVTGGSPLSTVGGLRVAASCTTSNGAVVSVSPATLQTDILGRATFAIDARTLRIALAGGTPSATCSFVATGTGTNSATKTVAATGANVDPTIQVSPNFSTASSQNVTATLSAPAPALDLSGITIDGTCTTTLATLTIDSLSGTSSKSTGAGGSASYSLVAKGLVTVNPTVTVTPTAQCVFKAHRGSIFSANPPATLNYGTGNACGSGYAALQPKPAGCGNPP